VWFGPTRGKRIALAPVRSSLGALERFGAICREAELNRCGTLYRVLLPPEIQACRDFRAHRTALASLPDVSPIRSGSLQPPREPTQSV
jgi:hypothetical protein